MRVYKNMLGDNSKIHIDEIATKLAGKPVKLSEAVIVDEGLSASGSYVRFGNGFQICYGSVVISSTSGTGDHKYGTAVFPMSFINNNYTANITPNAGGIANFGAYTYSDAKANQMGIWCTRRSTANIAMSYQVIGYWK